MNTTKTQHEWSKDAIFSKAQRYADIMHEKDHSDWEFGLWSAFTLEMLVRACLANLSPALVADGKDFNNILYAVGHDPNQQKYIPKSAEISDLLRRAENIYADFTREMLNFSVTHVNKRNTELHSGAMPFEGGGTSKWLPIFYSVCEVLLQEMDESLESLIGEELASEAKTHIVALKDESAKAVKQTINAHKTIWNSKEGDEKEKLKDQALTLSTRHHGHRVDCPACSSVALVRGGSVGSPKSDVDDTGVIEKHKMLPSSFECTACGLKISGFSKLVASGLGDTYTSTTYYDAAEYFNIDIEEKYQEMMHEDNNEPF